MYGLHAFADSEQFHEAVAALQAQAEVRHVLLGGVTADTGKALISAEILAESVDETFAALQGVGISVGDLSVSRIDFARPLTAEGVVADAAAENVSLRPSYLAMLLLSGTVTLAIQALRERARGHRALSREEDGRPEPEARQGAQRPH